MTTFAKTLAVGMQADERAFGPITRTHIVRYAGASGDFNPIHHDEPLARRAGLDSVLSIGMFQAGVLGTFLVDWLGIEHLHRFKLRFSARVWPGDTLTCSGVVTEVSTDDLTHRVRAELECRRAAHEIAVSAIADYVWSAS